MHDLLTMDVVWMPLQPAYRRASPSATGLSGCTYTNGQAAPAVFLKSTTRDSVTLLQLSTFSTRRASSHRDVHEFLTQVLISRW